MLRLAVSALCCLLLTACAVKPAPSLQEMTKALPETTKIPEQWKASLPGDGGACQWTAAGAGETRPRARAATGRDGA